MPATEISIIVPAYNEEALIQSTLEGLRSYLRTRSEIVRNRYRRRWQSGRDSCVDRGMAKLK